MSSLNHSILNNLVIPIPPLSEQRNQMKMARELLSETRRLEGLYTRKLEGLTALKQSLLHAAFSGDL